MVPGRPDDERPRLAPGGVIVQTADEAVLARRFGHKGDLGLLPRLDLNVLGSILRHALFVLARDGEIHVGKIR